ncbi:Ankyrin repeat [Geosmithia morbida]|uniref:Ankyrin repeat n=1 Tax=Geosmithia morbida TaxID=1094350 RepID=A0A9P5D3J6_9HYPO|nr:Ankyrin repeat [Geosmithia morbida]KAF4120574.1 Ankyrin repeat [Geosmithia morbida]
MASSAKYQGQCLDLCTRTTEFGDKIAVHLLEYLTSVTHSHLHGGTDILAHEFLSTCHVLLSIQAGLEECTRTKQFFPHELLAEMEKKFRLCQADFNVLDQMLLRALDGERKHSTMSKMKRGLSKLFGDMDFHKMSHSLEVNRNSLQVSSLMFQWSLGEDKVQSGTGIGLTGLQAALDRLDSKKTSSASGSRSVVNVPPPSFPNPAPPNRQLTHEAPHTPSHEQPSLPPLPWMAEGSSLMSRSNGAAHPDESNTMSEARRWTATSPSSVDERQSQTGKSGGHPYASALDEALSQHSGGGSNSDETILEEMAGLDLGSTAKGVVHLKASPASVPRWTPRCSSPGSGDGAGLKGALISAVRAGNHKLVEQLLDRGVSPNTGPEINSLIDAIRGQHAQCVRLLLRFGADPNDRDHDGMTPLLAAVEKGFLPGAAMLAKYGADPNMKAGHDEQESATVLAAGSNNLSAEGETLLTIAINKKTPPHLIEMLLHYGADPNAKTSEGKTALFEAITCNRPDIVTCLLDNGADPNLPGPKHLLWPATYRAPCLKILLERGADSRKAPGIMELATSVNNIESIRVLLKANVDPNAKKDGVYTPLCTSIRDNRPDILRLLLSNGADPNVPASEYPAFKCITHNRLRFLPELVKAGADLNNPKGIVETAVACNNMEALEWLLNQGMDPNERCPKGRSPLTTAIRDKRLDMIDLLISRGADPNKRGEDWPIFMAVHTPSILRRILHVLSEPRAFKGVVERAVVANQLESVKMLLAAGVSVEDKNGGVFSPLTSAIREDHREIVEYLLDPNGGNADVNAPGEHLPIVKALRRYHGEDTAILEMLLAHGADPNKMYRGWNAMFQAVELGDLDVLKIVLEKGGGIDLEAREEMGQTVVEMAESRGWDDAVQLLNEHIKQ